MSLYKQRSLTNFYTFSFFSVKSSCALVTREECAWWFHRKKSWKLRSKRSETFKSVAMKSKNSWKQCRTLFFAYIDSNRNRFSEWAIGFRNGNFFIPWVVKNLKISPWEGKGLPPAGLRPLGGKLFFPWANFWRFFQPLGWRNFHTWNPAHSEIPYFFPGDKCAWRFHKKNWKGIEIYQWPSLI